MSSKPGPFRSNLPSVKSVTVKPSCRVLTYIMIYNVISFIAYYNYNT